MYVGLDMVLTFGSDCHFKCPTKQLVVQLLRCQCLVVVTTVMVAMHGGTRP